MAFDLAAAGLTAKLDESFFESFDLATRPQLSRIWDQFYGPPGLLDAARLEVEMDGVRQEFVARRKAELAVERASRPRGTYESASSTAW